MFLRWTSSQDVEKLSNGKLMNVTQFTFKARVEDYIRSLPIRSAFFSPGSFMQNFQSHLKPKPTGDGTYAISNLIPGSTQIPLINVSDIGKFIGAILAEPNRYEG